ELAGQMILLGGGLGLTTAPATEAIMGVVPKEKAGIGSAMNDATREAGGTLGVAVIGSVVASLYPPRLALPAALPVPPARAANHSLGRAFAAPPPAPRAGPAAAAARLRSAPPPACSDGCPAGCLVAPAVAALGAIPAPGLPPAQPTAPQGHQPPPTS